MSGIFGTNETKASARVNNLAALRASMRARQPFRAAGA
ncbi:hypothetical protein VD0002_g3458 [Verticillium dahliae]|uniref:Uncharacterized protein n=1 Tax=Verticillium dahliae TaxID=27337 RepID=A0AA44WIT5_VERDA|nr:hypothetical protein BJF96_g4197 [Verticillium dahliae]PNH53151.1 hypothetical protein VD0003_g4214 [Verticillium dahliae]PNH65630.1 hypothetical protein VD0002_g3458 [Verticillium dahliae]